MSTNPPKDEKSAAPEAAAVGKAPQPGQPVRLEQVMDFAFLEVMARQRLNLSRRGLACS